MEYEKKHIISSLTVVDIAISFLLIEELCYLIQFLHSLYQNIIKKQNDVNFSMCYTISFVCISFGHQGHQAYCKFLSFRFIDYAEIHAVKNFKICCTETNRFLFLFCFITRQSIHN